MFTFHTLHGLRFLVARLMQDWELDELHKKVWAEMVSRRSRRNMATIKRFLQTFEVRDAQERIEAVTAVNRLMGGCGLFTAKKIVKEIWGDWEHLE